jgi:IgGFc binding protein
VLVRTKSTTDMTFKDVTLDCAGVLTGWQAVGSYEWTRVDLSTGNFQPVNGCNTGAHQISSDAPFGLWVWGWGTPTTTTATRDVSYGYPTGMNVQSINSVVSVP